ncbi:hypothetical protein Pcinc_016848 [Petrolisthes cinctipes]|uniref:GPI-anchor transamidase component GPAA1 n=1 Tax=Petrolisthes cinctipes TaxID=88211 RepID=A0AAE1FQ91_PETCI|nr:hypothetical protein Pcinc_016848 [Petrolisthes cinctipes]
MGLLTDPGTERSQLPALLERHHRPLCVTLYIIGLVWFLALAHNSLNHGTYFSENALLPGLVEGDFHGDSLMLQYLQSLTEEAEKHPAGMPYAWLVGQFTQLGLDTFTHNFTLHYPMGKEKSFSGQNVYGILRAGRGSSTEAIVVAAPYRPPSSFLQTTAPSIALMLAMAQFFSKQVYWAKDIIFLVTEHEQLGTEAWLGAYHHGCSGGPVLDHGGIQGRAGAIQAAINLELHSARVSHLDVKVEGLNGQLPNLDLVNLIHRLCQRENVPHTFKNRIDHPRPESWGGWLQQLETLLSMVASQATGVPTGNHGLFHRYGIAAVTVEGSEWNSVLGRRVGVQQLGRVLEGVCRSLNNLLERFHQSFFFYLLPSTTRYISIGVYMPPFALLAGGLLVKALALWFSTSCAADIQTSTSTPFTVKKVDYSVMGSIPVVVTTHVVSAGLAATPPLLSRLGLVMALSTEDSVFFGLLGAAITLLFLPHFMAKCTEIGGVSWEVVKTVAVLELAVLVFAGAVYNFSLALIITLTFTPVALMASPSHSRLGRLAKSLLVLSVHPLSLLMFSVLLDTVINFPGSAPLRLLWRAYMAIKRALMYSVADALIYSNWVFDAACVCLLPVWLLLWQVVHCHP